jgi:hypothetical protein
MNYNQNFELDRSITLNFS